jgi:tyrosyl-tRNA synthetase
VSFLEELEQRGLLQQVTDRDGLAKLLASQVVPVYAGYDPTSSSLHVGNLVPTILLKRFQLAGHRPIVLVGGATGMIGDPSGKSDERNLLDEQTLATNVAGIRAQLARLMDVSDATTGALLVNNHDWTKDVTYLEFLRDYGKYLTINYMLAKDSVKNRAGSEAATATVLLDADLRIQQADGLALLRTDEKAGSLVDLVAAKDLDRVRAAMAASGTAEFALNGANKQEIPAQIAFTTFANGTAIGVLRERQAGISYTEFSYMFLQSFDFVQLAKSHGCRLQVGGSDQYGNITAGCELSHKMRGPQLFGLVAPLLLDSTGQKMGKTSTGERIWLDADRTTPFQFYQYWLNQPDADMPRFLRMFSLKSLAEIDQVLAAHDADRSQRIAQRELARVMTTWVHGADQIPVIEAAGKLIFSESLEGIGEADLRLAAATVPTIDLPRVELEAGISIVDLFIRSGLVDSKSKARQLIEKDKGAFVNHVKSVDPARMITVADLATETMLVLRKGKRSICLVRLV